MLAGYKKTHCPAVTLSSLKFRLGNENLLIGNGTFDTNDAWLWEWRSEERP